MSADEEKSSALPKAWIIPIRLAVYSVLAACSAYLYFHIGELEITHYLILLSIVAVTAMVLLDCRVSNDYWQKQEAASKTDQSKP